MKKIEDIISIAESIGYIRGLVNTVGNKYVTSVEGSILSIYDEANRLIVEERNNDEGVDNIFEKDYYSLDFKSKTDKSYGNNYEINEGVIYSTTLIPNIGFKNTYYDKSKSLYLEDSDNISFSHNVLVNFGAGEDIEGITINTGSKVQVNGLLYVNPNSSIDLKNVSGKKGNLVELLMENRAILSRIMNGNQKEDKFLSDLFKSNERILDSIFDTLSTLEDIGPQSPIKLYMSKRSK